jgi:cell division septum initiation protein DivIVA/transcriptional regulator with XRE-family HTH domain
LTQRELAEAVGVSLGKIERYESGAESPADVLQQVATVLGEPISWLETGDQSARSYDQRDLTGLMNDVAAAGAGAALDAPTQVEAEATPSPPERLDTLRDSDFGRDVAIQELEATSSPPAEPEAASAPPALPAPPLQIELADLPRKTLGYHPNATAELFEQVADFYTRLWEERAGLAQRLDAVQAELADEQRKHGAAAAEIAQLEQELERVNRNQLALADLVAKLEAELRRAEGRAAEATDRLEQADEELQRFREQERSLAEALVWARHTASTLSDKAEQEAAKIVQAAEQRAADLVSERQREVERLTSERQRFETLTKEVQEDLSEFLLGTLDRLKERVEPTAVSDDSA